MGLLMCTLHESQIGIFEIHVYALYIQTYF